MELVFFQMQGKQLSSVRATLVAVDDDCLTIETQGKEVQIPSYYAITEFLNYGKGFAVLGLYESNGFLFPLTISEWFQLPIQTRSYEPIRIEGDPNLSGELVQILEERNFLISELKNLLTLRKNKECLTRSKASRAPEQSDPSSGSAPKRETYLFE